MEVGRRLGESLGPGDVVLLSGTLGAGKTVMARGIATGLGAEGWNGSPTFTLVNEYQGRSNLAHVDLYRLSAGDADDLGLEEYVDRGWVLVLEWPERDPGLIEHLGARHVVAVSIDYVSPEMREITIEERRS
jgi:tRNA threonylcarbamoyladenosine biosynthesis protein TsaE